MRISPGRGSGTKTPTADGLFGLPLAQATSAAQHNRSKNNRGLLPVTAIFLTQKDLLIGVEV